MVYSSTEFSKTKESRFKAILSELRERIVTGKWNPGHRLPTREQFSSEFSASKMTVQRALEQLIEDGFVVPRGRAGTFVSNAPPHLSTVGLVFSVPQHAACWEWSPFFNGLVRQAAVLNGETTGKPVPRLSIYYGVTDPWDSRQSETLTTDLKEGRLKGLVVVPGEIPWHPSAPLNIPVVGVGLPVTTGTGQGSSIDFPWDAWCQRAVEMLRRSGHRRLAILNNAARPPHDIEQLAQLARDRGMTVKPQWVQGIFADFAHWARRSVHLLMDGSKARAPDCLLITDDSLIAPAISGLVDVGARVPRDVYVLAWSNLPNFAPTPLPIVRLGFDLRLALRLATDLIDRHRLKHGLKPQTVAVPVQSEDELAVRTSNQIHARIA